MSAATDDLAAIARSAFVAHGPDPQPPAEAGPLAGLGFAVKDLIDVAGYPSGWGSPDRLAEAVAACATAPSVLVALEAGAHLVGKTHTDELACGMFGMNPHYGTPINPAAPGRAPGGSSSGSAVAVAAGLADFALGTDTGGSVRVPASFCGLYGLRTTFGRVPVAGVMPMAPSFDTVGWLARDAGTMQRVGEAYFGPVAETGRPRLLVAEDAFAFAVPAVAEALRATLPMLGDTAPATLYEEGIDFWLDTFKPLQLHDLWSTLGSWASAPGRNLSPAVAERIELSSTIEPARVAAAVRQRESLAGRLADLLGTDGFIVIPTVHDLPPPVDATVEEQIAFRDTGIALTCIASLCRLPQISIPAGFVDGCPVGLSLIGGPRADERLLAYAAALGPLAGGRP